MLKEHMVTTKVLVVNNGYHRVKVLQDLWQCMSPTHRIAMFSMESLASGLVNRLGKVADVPAAPDDGVSKYILQDLQKQTFVS